MDRRHFLRSASASTVALQAFRKTEISRLAMGTGTDGVGGSSNQTRNPGMQGRADLFRAAYDQGMQTARLSALQLRRSGAVKVALESGPREKVTMLTKTKTHRRDLGNRRIRWTASPSAAKIALRWRICCARFRPRVFADNEVPIREDKI